MFRYKNTVIDMIKGDITEVKAEIIVNAANNSLLGGGGVDGAIHRKGGSIILEQCKKIGGCPTGEARITTGGNLPCLYVIHTVGPVYREGSPREQELLFNAYYNSLKLAEEYKLKDIAFPSISTGAYGYPVDKAVEVAVSAVIKFIDEGGLIDKVTFVLFNDKDYNVYSDYLNKQFA